MQPEKGFTLVEFLIVFAVMGILVILSVDVVTKAKIRAEVVKVEQDFQNVSKALFSYQLDHDGRILQVKNNPPIKNFLRYIHGLHELTTPHSYLSNLPRSPWNNNATSLQYNNDRIRRRTNHAVISLKSDDYLYWQWAGAYQDHYWSLVSYGPSQVRKNVIYDPTNGVISIGGIVSNSIGTDDFVKG